MTHRCTDAAPKDKLISLSVEHDRSREAIFVIAKDRSA
jgi:hypothetical protein